MAAALDARASEATREVQLAHRGTSKRQLVEHMCAASLCRVQGPALPSEDDWTVLVSTPLVKYSSLQTDMVSLLALIATRMLSERLLV